MQGTVRRKYIDCAAAAAATMHFTTQSRPQTLYHPEVVCPKTP